MYMPLIQIESALDIKELLDLSRQQVVYIDFYAEWCDPCKELEKSINTYAEYKDIHRIDIDALPVASSLFHVESIPLLIELELGQEINRFIGVTSIKEKLNSAK